MKSKTIFALVWYGAAAPAIAVSLLFGLTWEVCAMQLSLFAGYLLGQWLGWRDSDAHTQRMVKSADECARIEERLRAAQIFREYTERTRANREFS